MDIGESFIQVKLQHRLDLKPASCELSLVFKWRSIEEQAHYPQVSREEVGPRGDPNGFIDHQERNYNIKMHLFLCPPVPGPSK